MTSAPKIPVKVDVQLSAKAALEVRTEIPSASTGRFVDAITDIIRPWSEARGLKADLIRFQREEVALRIAQQAADRIKIEGGQISPVPLKVLIPLLEKGSQEQIDDDFMIGLWANLLASSAIESTVPPRFVSILGELNSHQAQLFVNISGRRNGVKQFRDPSDVRRIMTAAGAFEQNAIKRWLCHKNILDELNKQCGIFVTEVRVQPTHSSMTLGGKFVGETASHFFRLGGNELDAQVLESLGLAKKFQDTLTQKHWLYSITLWTLTPFGYRLLNVVEPSDA